MEERGPYWVFHAIYEGQRRGKMGSQTSVTQSQTSDERPPTFITAQEERPTLWTPPGIREIFSCSYLCSKCWGLCRPCVAFSVSLSQCATLSEESAVYL